MTTRHAIRALREAAAQLQREARILRDQADAMERTTSGTSTLSGPQAAAKLAGLIPGGDAIHYQRGLERLERAGFDVRGTDPPATLLTALSRHPMWQASTTRGVYERVAISEPER